MGKLQTVFLLLGLISIVAAENLSNDDVEIVPVTSESVFTFGVADSSTDQDTQVQDQDDQDSMEHDYDDGYSETFNADVYDDDNYNGDGSFENDFNNEDNYDDYDDVDGEEFDDDDSGYDDLEDDYDDDLVPLGEDKSLNVTFEEDGTPLVTIDKAAIDALAALLMEHDERFHFEFPGHQTILPTETNVSQAQSDESNDDTTDTFPEYDQQFVESSQSELNDDMTEENGNISDNDDTVSSEKDDNNLSEDGHMLASRIDPSLSGHVDIADTADLVEMVVDKPPKLVRHRRAYFWPNGQKWPNGEYNYVFDRQLDPQVRTWLLQAFQEIGSKVPCVKFQPATRGNTNYIIHTSSAQGCFATTLGKVPGRQSMVNEKAMCGYETTMHEVFHALGAIHTQARPDRDDYVEINWQNIKQSSVRQFKKEVGRVTPQDSEYDYYSTMHYPYYTGHSVNPRVGSVRSKDRTIRLKKYGHYKFSDTDYKSLRQWYGCGEDAGEKKMPQPRRRIRLNRGRMRLNRNRGSSFRSASSDSVDCDVSPWGEWTWCTAGFQSRKRTVVQEAEGVGLSCPTELVQRRLCVRSYVKRSAGQVEEEGPGSAVSHLKKTVEVVEGTPIVLVVSNPRNLTVQWFEVVDGEEQVILPDSSLGYRMFSTAAGNERLEIPKSTIEDHDEMLFVTKISMRKSLLRLAWNIHVVSEDEYLSERKGMLEDEETAEDVAADTNVADLDGDEVEDSGEDADVNDADIKDADINDDTSPDQS